MGQGRGTGRWDFEPDADLNYAASSADAGVGFAVLGLGLALQAISAVDSEARGTCWILVVPITGLALALIVAARWRHRREIAVMRIRIDGLVVKRSWPPTDWQVIVHGYSRALTEVGHPPKAGEDAWAHLIASTVRIAGCRTGLSRECASPTRRTSRLAISRSSGSSGFPGWTLTNRRWRHWGSRRATATAIMLYNGGSRIRPARCRLASARPAVRRPACIHAPDDPHRVRRRHHEGGCPSLVEL